MPNAKCQMPKEEARPQSGRPPEICARTLAFAARILKPVRSLPSDAAGWAVAKQLARSGTGIGANVHEAQLAQTRREFVRRINIARAEARETEYWLQLTGEAALIEARRIEAIKKEANELSRILAAIVKRSERGLSG